MNWIASFLFLISLAITPFQSESGLIHIQTSENPYLALAKIENSSGQTIDSFIEARLAEGKQTEEEMFLFNNLEQHWLMNGFIQDNNYKNALRASLAAFREIEITKEQEAKYKTEIKESHPYFYKTLPYLISFMLG